MKMNNYKIIKTAKEKILLKTLAILFLLLQSFNMVTMAQVIWPVGQLLPSFPASASTQDLFYLNGTVAPYSRLWRWQAENSPFISHSTGHLETDGWLCQVGVDSINKYMMNGPNDKTITMGLNIAEFKMKIDNNTLNNDPVVDIDVRNATTGIVLATQTVTRTQFTTANSYVSFKLPFLMPADSQSIELRVFWRGVAYTKVDYVGITQDNADAETYLFTSLKGIVNMTQPRIFSYEGDASAEGAYTWMQSLGVKWIETTYNWSLITKYKNEISGLIVYDPKQIHTVNLATMLAKGKKALIASPSLLLKLTSAPYNFPVLADLRNQFTTKLQVYQTLYDTYWPNIDHRLLIGLDPTVHKASLREYAVALGAAVVWLDPRIAAENALLIKFLTSMPAGSNCMGWWPEEGSGVTKASNYGIATIASDFSTNLTFHSGMPRTINIKPMPSKPTLENKIYVAFVLSDGDNLQYVEHLLRKLWNNPDRGKVPMGWTMSPAMVDAMPGALNYYHKTSTVNDNLISGPSGYGYVYPNSFFNSTALNQFVTKTEDYNSRAGFRVVTVWNTITGNISLNSGNSYANYAPTLLGLTGQNTGAPLVVYKMSLPGMPLSCNYCYSEQTMIDAIASAAAGWTSTKPKFIIIQAAPWNNVTPTSFLNVMNTLGANYSVVRPDQLFQLLREANNLSVNPGGIEGSGIGLTGSYYNGLNFETPVGARTDTTINFNWGTNSPMASVKTDSFSIRWTGKIQPRYSGTYTFYITSDNGRRVWIDNQLIIDKWTNLQGTYTDTISLTAGQKYDLKVEYFETNKLSNCKLEWASGLQSREVVPQSQLYNDISETGITDPAATSGINIVPNPVVNGSFSLLMNNFNDEQVALTLYDLTGKIMLREDVQATKQVDVSKVPAGTYILSIRTKENNINKKIVIR